MGIDPLSSNPLPPTTTPPLPLQEQIQYPMVGQEPSSDLVDQNKDSETSVQSTIREGKDEDKNIASSPVIEVGIDEVQVIEPHEILDPSSPSFSYICEDLQFSPTFDYSDILMSI